MVSYLPYSLGEHGMHVVPTSVSRHIPVFAPCFPIENNASDYIIELTI